jgi:murein DD-endopeptidase MepM/ murein hydrolase activator NlpD
MVISRRRMILSLLASVPTAALAPVARAIPTGGASPLAMRNFGESGRAALTEGETLLVEIAFRAAVIAVDGAFPIAITPQSAGGRALIEPQPLFFFPGSDGRTWRTILSAPLDSGGQRATLRFAALAQSGRRESTSGYEYESLRGSYGRSILRLSRETTDPSPEIAERKRREFEANAALFRRRSPRLWSDEFAAAVPFASRNNFGLRRTVNGTLHYRHGGLDYPAPIGTPVRAINDGRVAFSGEQWTPGRVVILDHGGGIFSRYLHLSARHVAAGDHVGRGEVIGLSGNTGGQRPAPHLHLDTFVNGTAVSPRSLRQTASRLLELERGSGAP